MEYFGKISVRKEGGLKISKFFLSDALDFSILSENHKVSLELKIKYFLGHLQINWKGF